MALVVRITPNTKYYSDKIRSF